MSNVITAIVPKILAKGLLTLRETCVMPGLVNSDYSAEARKFGTTIDVPIPQAQTVGDVTPSNTPPAPASITAQTVQIPLDKWKKTEFYLTDKEMREIDMNQSFYPMQVAESARSLANKVNNDILANYTGIYGYAGTAGTTPFATTTAAATDARKVLARQLCPKDLRSFILDADAEANALSLSAFQFVNQAGTDVSMKEGEIGRKFGFNFFMEDSLPTHTKGAAGTILLDDTVLRPVGTKTLHMDGATTKPAVGDVFTIAGDLQTYVVTGSTNLVSTDTDVSFEPGLKVAIPAADGNEVVTFKASHVVNLAFHRDAFAFANRGVDNSLFSGGNILMQMQDPVTQLTLAIEVSRQYKQTVWEFSMLYGSKLVRAELGTRIAG